MSRPSKRKAPDTEPNAEPDAGSSRPRRETKTVAIPPEFALFASKDPALWKSRLDQYQDAVAKVAAGKTEAGEAERMVQLDRLVFDQLPATVESRRREKSNPVLSKEDFVNIVDWKMHRAKRRPNLLQYARNNQPAVYAKAVTAAERHVSKLASPSTREGAANAIIKALSEPKGIGPATSLVIGSILSPHLAFYGDEAVKSIPDMLGPGGKIEYKASYAMDFMRKIWAKVDELNGVAGQDFMWTAKDIEKALYVDYQIRKKVIAGPDVPA